jgi:LysM repeat protein
VAAVAVLVLLGALGLSRLGPVNIGPQATPTAAPRPSPPPIAAPEASASAPEPAPEPARPSTYVVEPGDSLGGIARELGTTIDALIAANNLDDADTLYIGQELVVPPQ